MKSPLTRKKSKTDALYRGEHIYTNSLCMQHKRQAEDRWKAAENKLK